MTGIHPAVAVEGGNLVLVLVVALIALGALAMAVMFRQEVLAAPEGSPSMKVIATAVQEGANAYLQRQFRTLAVFAVVAFFLLLVLPADDALVRVFRSVFFLVGAGFSAAIGYLGMSLAVRANLRVAAAAENTGREPAMNIGFRTGAAVGMATVGLGLLGASTVVLFFQDEAPDVLEGFGFGAALLAMFMRVGGGIFTKAADVGADLVGKVENNIPEDDPRNAATIADNVGDNVGDCAGMAADLFESYAVTLVAALILGSQAFGDKGLVFPLLVPAIGALTAVAGVYLCKPRVGENGLTTINRAFYISAGVAALACIVLSFVYLPTSFDDLTGIPPGGSPLDLAFGYDAADGNPALIAALAVVIGVVLAAAILALTGYFTGTEFKPVKDVGSTSLTGPATVILSGLAVGFESAVYTTLVIGAAVFGAFLLGGGSLSIALFAVALAGCGLLTTVGVIVAMDTFGPVSDNAQGIAEMSGDVGPEGAQILTELDAVGNTTKAITKGIAIATAVLAASALFGSYIGTAIDKLLEIEGSEDDSLSFFVFSPDVLVGLLIGVAVVFLFSGLAISAVGRAAGAVVYEVRRQFREIPGIMEGTGRPEYGKVVDIVTRESLRELATPGILAILAPIAVGFGLGVGPLAGFLAGAIGAGTLMAVFLANAGGAWDNAKKLVEDGHHGGKGSPAHEATIIGDTVGDPFKDTAGPAINPLIKVMNLVSLLIVGAVVSLTLGEDANRPLSIVIALVAAAGIAAAVVVSKRRSVVIGDDDGNPAPPPAPPAPPTGATDPAVGPVGDPVGDPAGGPVLDDHPTRPYQSPTP
ncbi:sodium-translocating pyrophosphatase [Nocardioides marmotae]|uniref:K(+)-insensitive pyrophosphate-energized proton pump n=1 Tax=Nocardioides marmotae TaxID=2663857 RepID=A0A6I3J8L7_9ACTN|nr:sodium-translocating pyrophosphatase [Nocardioides marmotae]MCR6029840.1 sodium-translocating pyrophosphatase [Gordonia jinghuaiqii]MBC9732777.1 sodium-translocating pyrophosphatase [Nocardioides marmotae]MTB83892.1 sodium-translocating pyrophosphatase [Nocardioides marmotae]MTB93470.1 sodium-translocating pyrophosphatase [Nocardioides marmotae]QKD99852.1 sodium-translocating pyrophosphatase [Nocardioides marmotae]